jgi:hypothetical protein
MSIATEKLCRAALRHAEAASAGVNEFAISSAAYPHERVAVLLARYPNLLSSELDEVTNFVKWAQPAQLQRLRSSPVVSLNLDKFVIEQNCQLMSNRERAVWTITALLMILTLCWVFWSKRPQPIAPRTKLTTHIPSQCKLAHRHSEAQASRMMVLHAAH